jgi:acyl dehydratase
LSARFSRPVFPGETIRTEFFGTDGEVRFRSRVVERDLIVLDRGSAVFAS